MRQTEQALAEAHGRLLADKSLQFDFTAMPPPRPPPSWLNTLVEALGKAFIAAAPVMKYVFWAGLAAGVALIAWLLLRDVVRIQGARRGKPTVLRSAGDAWRPAPEAARALLSDVDVLASRGQFSEAVHLLLTRSIDDFAGWRPGTVRPALTSRDLARAPAMPPEARDAFGLIAQVVEHSLFGGRPVNADSFGTCRRAYEAFALADHWR